MELAEQLDLLLGNFDHLSPRMRHLTFKTEVCGERIDVRCTYIAFRDGLPTFDDFVSVVASHTIAFCLPQSEIAKAKEKTADGDYVVATTAMYELTEKAKGLFIKARKGSHRSGEGGEIILYILNEWQLQAPQIVSKMYLKTSHNMPVHGTDGIHAKYDPDKKALRIFWGESKAYQTLDGALNAALKSIAEFREEGGEDREIEIVSDHLDIEAWDDEARTALLDYLDPYSEASNKRIPAYSCLLLHESSYLSEEDPGKAETKFVKELNISVGNFIDQIRGKVNKWGLENQRFEFFLLPVPSVQEFRDKFQEKIGWPND